MMCCAVTKARASPLHLLQREGVRPATCVGAEDSRARFALPVSGAAAGAVSAEAPVAAALVALGLSLRYFHQLIRVRRDRPIATARPQRGSAVSDRDLPRQASTSLAPDGKCRSGGTGPLTGLGGLPRISAVRHGGAFLGSRETHPAPGRDQGDAIATAR